MKLMIVGNSFANKLHDDSYHLRMFHAYKWSKSWPNVALQMYSASSIHFILKLHTMSYLDLQGLWGEIQSINQHLYFYQWIVSPIPNTITVKITDIRKIEITFKVHLRSSTIVPIKRAFNFLLVVCNNHVSVLHHFRDIITCLRVKNLQIQDFCRFREIKCR